MLSKLSKWLALTTKNMILSNPLVAIQEDLGRPRDCYVIEILLKKNTLSGVFFSKNRGLLMQPRRFYEPVFL
jgi:hypothetical protein